MAVSSDNTLRRSSGWWSAAAVLAFAPAAAAQEPCFERLDNGVDMTGWQKSTTNPHGPGDGWTVEDGAFVGRQTSGQQGGILMTDASYEDVEVLFEVKIDWGCDSGFFFRTTAGSRAYQVTIDHLPDSGVGTIWGEGFSPELREIPYFLTNDGNAAVVAPNQEQTPIFDLADWPTLWDPMAFNEIRARIEGSPPHIQVWISGTKVMDFTDATLRGDVGTSGPLAIQVHSGSRWIQDGTVAFKNIRARDLSVPCEDPGSAGAGGMAGTAGTSSGGQTSGGSGTAGQAAGGAGLGGLAGNAGAGRAGQGGAAAGGTSGGGGMARGGSSGGDAASGGQPASGGGGVGGGASGTLGNGGASAGNAGGTAGGGPKATESDGACGCRVAGREREHGTLAIFLGVAGVAVRAMRRRRHPREFRTGSGRA
jgi:hypothetical protein